MRDSNPNQTYIERYLQTLRTQRQLATNTTESYAHDLAELLKFGAATDPHFLLEQIKPQQIRQFAAQMHGRGLNGASIARKLSAWRGFFDWLAELVAIAANPVDGIRPPRRAAPLPQALPPDAAVRLVSSTNPADADESATQACNQAMFELLYSSGLRVSELTGLDIEYAKLPDYVSAGWVDFDAGDVIVTGKGSKMRSVPIGAAALSALSVWREIRNSLVAADPHPLFLNRRGTRISPRTVQLRIKAHAQALGLPTDVHPHVLRHSFASHLLQSSGDLRAVQELLGHSSIAATQIYTSLDFQHLAKIYDAAHPRAGKKPQKM